jgi:hypothetical protein
VGTNSFPAFHGRRHSPQILRSHFRAGSLSSSTQFFFNLTPEEEMKRIALVIIIAGGVVALAAWQLAPGDSAHATIRSAHSPVAQTASATPTPYNNAGYVVHFDEHGNIVEEVSPQSEAEFNAQLNEVINTSSEGLVEKASPAPGGGTMVDLQGRFQSAATATVDKNGKVVVPCLTNEADVRAFTSATAADHAAKKK